MLNLMPTSNFYKCCKKVYPKKVMLITLFCNFFNGFEISIKFFFPLFVIVPPVLQNPNALSGDLKIFFFLRESE
jgi:hypothetical protein